MIPSIFNYAANFGNIRALFFSRPYGLSKTTRQSTISEARVTGNDALVSGYLLSIFSIGIEGITDIYKLRICCKDNILCKSFIQLCNSI